jgi:disulfide oxidoreductase YuzD
MQAEKEVGRLWLIALPHLTSEEKDIVTQYLQAGIRRDYEKTQQVVEKINATNLNSSQHTQQILDSIVKDIKETK